MVNRFFLLLSFTLPFLSCAVANRSPGDKEKTQGATLELPIAGNTWVTGAEGRTKMLTNNGVESWTGKGVQFATYIRVSQPGNVRIALQAKTDGESKLKISLGGKEKTVTIKGDVLQQYTAGEWKVTDTGYVKIILSGVSKTGQRYAEVTGYSLSGTAVAGKTAFVATNEGNFYYWGRRGPSVHLSYPFAESLKAKWFYNEVTVPEGDDVIGSYYMANGFGEGYFGIQVNSPTERRILFSVWSPFSTDDPKSIPKDQRIRLLKKGDGVTTGEFGNEGSGGQSFLRYNWKAGVTYKFLLKGEPDGKGNTVYTAYFFAPEKKDWMLIASFSRPKTDTYLKRFHSFLENFIPEQGDKERKVFFNNQWVGDAAGNWTELTKANFTYDNTAAKGYRMDYAGGLRDGQFYLRNCGFFADYTPFRSSFNRPPLAKKPVVVLEQLP